jgi:hypothetical protein
MQIPVLRKTILHPTSSIHQPPSPCNMSDTYSEAEKRIEQALDEMRALESGGRKGN